MARNGRPLLEAILISNENGKKSFENMEMVFLNDLGFQQINKREDICTNVHASKWDHKTTMTDESVKKPDECCLKCLIRGHDFSRTDCFLFCISTHGAQRKGESFVVFLGDKNTAVNVNAIIDLFSDANCPELAGKPRILMFDACRGDEKFQGNVNGQFCNC